MTGATLLVGIRTFVIALSTVAKASGPAFDDVRLAAYSKAKEELPALVHSKMKRFDMTCRRDSARKLSGEMGRPLQSKLPLKTGTRARINAESHAQSPQRMHIGSPATPAPAASPRER